jgi:hypothetical protein
MISVRNRLLPLSGNKGLLVVLAALTISACSPKVRKVVVPPAAPPVVQPPPPKAAVVLVNRTSTIAMLLPFDLDKLNPGNHYTHSGLTEADMSLDYYQGFKLALDSLTAQGYTYRLQLFDTKDQSAQTRNLASNQAVRTSDMIVGPVFPDDIKAFTSANAGAHQLIISPLSPASPASFRNTNLVTVATPLEYHAKAAAKYIVSHLKPTKVFILSSGYSDENSYILPFKKAIDSMGGKQIKAIVLKIVRGQLAPLEPQLQEDGPNVFIMPSVNQAFLTVTLHSLDTLSRKYPVILFGHPNWSKFAFLKFETLQRLKTRITSSERVSYKSPEVVNFTRSYFNSYHVEPSIYAIKGFDEGLYFGGLVGKGAGNLKALDQADFKGMHNAFHFIKKTDQGWVNTHVDILQYSNFELKKVE